MQTKNYEVPVDKLRWRCDPNLFKFKCTKDLAPMREFIGQDRAIRAVEFGLNMSNDGYNIYVAGLTGTGKTSMVKTYIKRLIAEKEVRGGTFALDDWCYLHNFQEPDRPQIVSLPQGKGKTFRDQIAELLTKVREEVSKAFSSEEYKAQAKKMVEDGQTKQQEVFEEIASEARKQGFSIQMTPAGPVLIPMVDGRLMEEKQFLSLKESTRKDLQTKQARLSQRLQTSFEKVTNVQQQMAERLRKADKDIGEFTVSRLFPPLFDLYSKWPKLNKYLADLKTYTMDNLDFF